MPDKWTEQEGWERVQAGRAKGKYGAQDQEQAQKQYDLIMDNQVEFMQMDLLAEIADTKKAAQKISHKASGQKDRLEREVEKYLAADSSSS